MNQKLKLISQIKSLAKRYYNLTGRPLGVTGEIGEYEACRLLNLRLAPARQDGYDATQGKKKIQIKTRRIISGRINGGRLGSIDLSKEWDSTLLVLLDERYQVSDIYKASRSKIEEELKKPGSKARNVRGQLGVSQFIRAAGGKPIWSK
ncbi:MAG: hypothetical protein HYT31_03065 [Parcubacteria group bacterium]|nr:hypothetical protein [Parcubacteria group bacterium]